MRRILSVVFSCMLLAGALLGEDKCPKPPSTPKQCPTIEYDGCVKDGFSDGVCKVPLDYFIEYQGCTGPHSPIQIAVGDYLLITNASGSIREKFSVGKFSTYKKLVSGKCDPLHSDDKLVEPFVETFIGSLQDSHKLQALQEGCYKVNLTLNQADPDHPGRSCIIDPHIIIKGGRLSLELKELNELKQLNTTLQEIKNGLKRLEEKEKEEKHHE